MEKLPMKLTNLSILFNSFVEKVQNLDSPQLSVEIKTLRVHELKELAKKIQEFFHEADSNLCSEEQQLFKKRISRICEQFDWELNFLTKSPTDFNLCTDFAKSFITSVLKLLGRKGCGVLILETYLKICLKVLCDISTYADSTGDVENLKLLLESLMAFSEVLKKYWHIVFLSNQKNSVMLSLSQIGKCLPFLLSVVEEKNKDMRKYIIDRLKQCFDCILQEVHNEDDTTKNNCGSEFINLMDSSLYILNQLSREIMDPLTLVENASNSLPSLKKIIDELLCHAMSIAQVTKFETDNKQIMSGSQKVLNEYEELCKAVKQEDVSNIKLNASSLTETLCRLEQKVNTAVLRLVLEVFTEVNSPLKNMVVKCRANSEVEGKLSTDLNVLISDFDLEMDRIMQIGLFAISCTSNVKRILGIKSCLASLESLEAELIPCLSALYVDTNHVTKDNFKFLVDHWLKEITDLKLAVDSILDPSAFTEVVQNRIQEIIQELKCDVPPKQQKELVTKILKFSKKLVKTIQTSIKDDGPKYAEEVTTYLIQLQRAIQECEAASVMLCNEEDINQISHRILKRCELLMSCVDNLHSCLVALIENGSVNETKESDEPSYENESPYWNTTRLPMGNYYKLCFSSSDSSEAPPNFTALTPFLNRGKLINKERSIMYMTPKKVEFAAAATPQTFDRTLINNRLWDKTPRSKKRSRCCKILTSQFELGNSSDLEITSILENLTQLSNTFHHHTAASFKTDDSLSETNGSSDEQTLTRDVASGQEKDINDIKALYTSSGCHTESAEDKPTASRNPAEDTGDCSVGDKLRKQFWKTLSGLSVGSYLHMDSEVDYYGTPERINDLKEVENKINFLKQRIPDLLP